MKKTIKIQSYKHWLLSPEGKQKMQEAYEISQKFKEDIKEANMLSWEQRNKRCTI